MPCKVCRRLFISALYLPITSSNDRCVENRSPFSGQGAEASQTHIKAHRVTMVDRLRDSFKVLLCTMPL